MDGNCTPVQVNLYEAFGGVEKTWGNSDNNRLGNTKEFDAAIGLYNHGFRYFDAVIGRYISIDPISYEGGFNLYVYCTNDPVNKFDPHGLKHEEPEEIKKIDPTKGEYGITVIVYRDKNNKLQKSVIKNDQERGDKVNEVMKKILDEGGAITAQKFKPTGINRTFYVGDDKISFRNASVETINNAIDNLNAYNKATVANYNAQMDEYHDKYEQGSMHTAIVRAKDPNTQKEIVLLAGILGAPTSKEDLALMVVTGGVGKFFKLIARADKIRKEAALLRNAGKLEDAAKLEEETQTLAKQLEKIKTESKNLVGGCFVAGTPISFDNGSVPIEQVTVGSRVKTSDGISETSVDAQSWKKITLDMPNPEGATDTIQIVVLRSPEWVQQTGCVQGGTIHFFLKEMGLEGDAKVVEVEPCPVIANGNGRVVLATMTRLNSDVRTLRLSDGKVLDLTGRHRLFSLERNDWTPTSELHVGERLQTQSGCATIAGITKKEGVFRVYNLEVETQHSYFAGESQILSHNTNPCAAPAQKLLNTPINITKDGMKHVADRHTVNNIPKFSNKSKFNSGENIEELIEGATQQPMTKQANGRFARTYDVGRNIGFDRTTGSSTSIMTVITEADGTLVTAFPGAP